MKRAAAVLLAAATLWACARQPQSPECVQYIDCAEAVDLSVWRQVQGMYGEKGTCWATNPITAEACTANCVRQLELLRADGGLAYIQCQYVDAGEVDAGEDDAGM